MEGKLIDRDSQEKSILITLRNLIESYQSNVAEKHQDYKLYLNGKVNPSIQMNNSVQQMNLATFLRQFKNYRWLYYLMVIFISDIYQEFDIYRIVTVIYIVLIFLKDCHKNIENNQQQYMIDHKKYKLKRKNSYLIRFKDIQIGDIIQLEQFQRIPNDMIILYSNKQIMVQSYDGTLQQKISVVPVQKYMDRNKENQFYDINSYFMVKRDSIYLENNQYELSDKVKIRQENMLDRNHRIISKGLVYGIVIKDFKNQRKIYRNEFSSFEYFVLKTYYYFMAIVVTSSLVLRVLRVRVWMDSLQMVELLTFSFYIHMDFGLMLLNSLTKKNVQLDGEIMDTTVNQVNSIQKLKDVNYMVINQNGVLSEGKKLKQIWIGNLKYTDIELKLVSNVIKEGRNDQLLQFLDQLMVNNQIEYFDNQVYCYNQTDQVLNKITSQLRFKYLAKNEQVVRFVNERNNEQIKQFKIVKQFNSSHKQGVLVEHDSQIFYYVWADYEYIIDQIENQELVKTIYQEQSNTSVQTIVFCKKLVSQYKYQKLISKDDKTIQKKLEKQLEYVAVVGLQSQLKDRVPETLGWLSVQSIWILSYEKAQVLELTAQQFGCHRKMYKMINMSDFIQIQNCLNELDSKHDVPLLIDYKSYVNTIKFHKRFFVEILHNVPFVLIAELKADAKELLDFKEKIVSNIRDINKGCVFSVGSDFTDLKMLQKSDVAMVISTDPQLRIHSHIKSNNFYALIKLTNHYLQFYFYKIYQLFDFIMIRMIVISVIQFYLFSEHQQASHYNSFIVIGLQSVSLVFTLNALVNIAYHIQYKCLDYYGISCWTPSILRKQVVAKHSQ